MFVDVRSSQSRCCLELHSCSPGQQPSPGRLGRGYANKGGEGGRVSREEQTWGNDGGVFRDGHEGTEEREGKMRGRRMRRKGW